MVCPNCGTLNPEGRENCFRCQQKLARSDKVETAACRWHPETRSIAACTACESPVCSECATHIEGLTYCPDCRDVSRSQENVMGAERVLSPQEMESYPYATLGWRMAAGAIDLLILGTGAILLALVLWMFTGSPPGAPGGDGVNLFFWCALALCFAVYHLAYYVDSGQTPGYSAVDLVVLRQDGRGITYPVALLRLLVKIGSISFFMLGYLWILWDSKNQAWHDRIAQTVVLRVAERIEPLPSKNG